MFSDATGGRPPFFSRLINGGNRSPRLVGGMRKGQDSLENKSLKKPAREPRNERKDLMALLRLNADHFMLGVMGHGSWSNKEPWLPKELKGFSD